MPKSNSKARRYTAEQKRKILETARKENLTGAQVKKRFGVSTLSFYRWRGPAKKRRARGRRATRIGMPAMDRGSIRTQVRSAVSRILPQVIREELASALSGLARRGR
ncbi:MAG TPA: transposase [Candidatus Eisenbacteria bacterium]|jgi:transposase-like protein